MVSKSSKNSADTPANVRFRSLPIGSRENKFDALNKLQLADSGWTMCPSTDRARFLPESIGQWSAFPKLDELFVYDGTGVMSGRVWIVSPDKASLERR